MIVAAGTPERYACRPLRRTARGARVSIGGRAAFSLEVPTALLDVLEQCTSFAPLSEHARSLGQRRGLNGEQIRELEGVLGQAASTGVLVAESEMLQRIAASAPPSARAPARVRSIFVPNRDRPGPLVRALSGLDRQLRRHGRAARLVVFDDGTDAGSRQRTIAAIGELEGRTGLRAGYVGQPQKEAFAARLASLGLPPELLAFALFPPERYVGANRNAMLLAAVNEPFLSCDDDTTGELFVPPSGGNGLRIAAGDPTELWFERRAMRSSADLLSLHEELLGQPVGACLRRFEGEVRLEKVTPHLLDVLEAGRGRVVVTAMGTWGDLGLGEAAPAYLTRLDEPSLSRLVADTAIHARVMRQHEALRCAPRTTLVDGGSHLFMTTACAYDNRVLLPPFFPVRRGDDPVFGETIAVCLAGGLFAHLPYAVGHLRPTLDRRRSRASHRRRQRRATSSLQMYVVLGLLLRTFEPPARGGTAARMRALGEHLATIAALPNREFERVVSSEWARQLVTLVDGARALLERGVDLPSWRAEAARELEYWAHHGLSAAPVDVDDVARRLGATSSEAAQTLVAQFGRLLMIWPDVIEAARQLRRQGVALLEEGERS
jgi:hypothetical protein